MSLISCPECGKNASSEAAACPSCGYPIKPPPPVAKKTWLWWVVGSLLVVPAFLMLMGFIGMLAAIAIPSFVQARSTSQRSACMVNLRQIESAKQAWIAASQAANGSEADEAAINAVLKGGRLPLCPSGGTYLYHKVGVAPECSLHGSLGQTQPPAVTSQPHP